MPTPIFLAQSGGPGVFKVGRAGYDFGLRDYEDTGGAGGVAYTGTLRTGGISPSGEDGLNYFRRLAFRIWHTGGFVAGLQAFVDGVQAVNAAGAPISVTHTVAAPTTSPAETVVEINLSTAGATVEGQLTFVSSSQSGIVAVESVEVHFLPVRNARARSGSTVLPA